MSQPPAYFDSQGQAASLLRVDIEDIREAKRDGCRAFRSGRVYRAELEAWLADRRAEAAKQRARNAPPPRELRFAGPREWTISERRAVLFEIMEALDAARVEGKLPPRDFVKIGCATLPLILQLGEVWGAQIDAAGYTDRWSESAAAALLQSAR